MQLCSISIELGKGSVNHNSRKFNASNTDPTRSHLNTKYINESLEQVFHKLFDEALERYNSKQKRNDRKIPNYLVKIQNGNQEKPFHEIVVQVGNRMDMGTKTNDSQLAEKILDEYMQSFQERNPYLRVFSAHLHMDEATPHLHIDFVPFTTNSNRGLDTRVSLKQALANQGFNGGSREETEWNQWVQSEKESLAKIMLKHNVEWEQQGNVKEHLSVLDYKKQERAKEVAELEIECDVLKNNIVNLTQCKEELEEFNSIEEFDKEYSLPEPTRFESAKSYKNRIEPLFKKIKEIAQRYLVKYIDMKNRYYNAYSKVAGLQRENERLEKSNTRYYKENTKLRKELSDFRLLRKIFGKDELSKIIDQARHQKRKNERNL